MIGYLYIISDVLLVISSVFVIDVLGISSVKSNKGYIASLAVVTGLSVSEQYFRLYESNLVPILIYPLMFISAYILIFKEFKFAHICVFIISELVTSMLSSCLTSVLLAFVFSNDYNDIVSLFLIRLLYFFAIVFYKKKKVNKIYSILREIPKHIFVLITVSILDIILLAEFNNHPNKSSVQQNALTVLIATLAILLIIIVLSLIFNVASKNYYTALNSLLEKQVAAQISHYEKLEKLNSDMRAFRHDYINHLSSINALIGEGCYSDAQNYIEKLTESTHRNEAVFYTGNRLADAILTDKNDSFKDFADIEFEGCITDKIGNSDICIILSNALDNAAEACKKCPERGKISVAAHIRQGYWIMTISNPTVSADSEGIMKTSKEDERNHGFGLLSIDRAVKNYDGTMAVSINNGVFEMTVVLKIPVEI